MEVWEIFLWVSGMPISYLCLKYDIKIITDDWDVAARAVVMALSLVFSWIGVIASVILYLVAVAIKRDEPAKR